jgi:P4 family phage/plasmid primase-like protien
MSTNINYKPLDLINDKEIIDSCTDFLHKLFPEEELYNYMYDHLASTLIGTSSNQTFNMYIGKGRNGKSALVGLMIKVLGEYQCVVASTMITEGRAKVGSVSPEVLQLKGKRYGVIQEPSPGEKINVGVMKQLTSGNDAIQARGLYKSEATTFIPQMKLVLCSNYMMKVESNDYGTWRRIRVVPYKSEFNENPVTNDPEKPYQYKLDPKIDENFDNWKETFAAMLVQRVFETNGIVKDCPIVLAASNEYRASQDYIAEYIRDKIVKDPNGKIKKTALNIDFSSWYMETYGNRGSPSSKDVHEYMDKEFGTQKNLAWTGVRIRYNERDDLNIPEDEDIDDGIDVSEL